MESTKEQRAAASTARINERTIADVLASSDSLEGALRVLKQKLVGGLHLTEEDREAVINAAECVEQGLIELLGKPNPQLEEDQKIVQEAIDELIKELEEEDDTTLGECKKLKEREDRELILRETFQQSQQQKVKVSIPPILIDHHNWSERLDEILEQVRYHLTQEHERLDDDVEVLETDVIWNGC